MSDKNETVVLDLDASLRLGLMNQLTMQMIKKGYDPTDFTSLTLRLNLPETWPLEGEVTLTQLVMLAIKLGMQINISKIEMRPMDIPAAELANAVP